MWTQKKEKNPVERLDLRSERSLCSSTVSWLHLLGPDGGSSTWFPSLMSCQILGAEFILFCFLFCFFTKKTLILNLWLQRWSDDAGHQGSLVGGDQGKMTSWTQKYQHKLLWSAEAWFTHEGVFSSCIIASQPTLQILTYPRMHWELNPILLITTCLLHQQEQVRHVSETNCHWDQHRTDSKSNRYRV